MTCRTLHPWRSAGSLIVVVALAATSCRSQNPPEVPTTPIGLSIKGEAPPGFSEEAVAVMRQLEGWRERRFLRSVTVEFVEPADGSDRRGGWYEPDTKRLVVLKSGSTRFQKGTMLHELFHALQDQHFDLAGLQRRARTLDESRALQALIEGEAMLAVAELLAYDFRQHAVLKPEGPLDPERFQKIFQYGMGQDYVRELRAKGGWPQIDQAFQTPPSSTRAIYLAGHPETARSATEPIPSQTSQGLGHYTLCRFLAAAPLNRSLFPSITRSVLDERFLPAKDVNDGAPRFEWHLTAESSDDAIALKTLFENLRREAQDLGVLEISLSPLLPDSLASKPRHLTVLLNKSPDP